MMQRTPAGRACARSARGRNSPKGLVLSVPQLAITGLVFVKAKGLGVHTPVYQLAGSELMRFAGRSIVFDWQHDRC